MLRARRGVPPIAYTSLNAFAAAIAPNQYGSSTMGVNTSTGWTRARSGAIRYTPASSAVLVATRTAGSVTGGRWRRTCARSAGPSLEAQPAQATIEVSLIRSRSVMDRSVSDVGATLIVTSGVAGGAGHNTARWPPSARAGNS